MYFIKSFKCDWQRNITKISLIYLLKSVCKISGAYSESHCFSKWYKNAFARIGPNRIQQEKEIQEYKKRFDIGEKCTFFEIEFHWFKSCWWFIFHWKRQGYFKTWANSNINLKTLETRLENCSYDPDNVWIYNLYRSTIFRILS